MLNYIPKYFTSKSIYIYFIALIIVSIVFLNYNMSFLWIVLGIVEVVGFFYFFNLLTKRWQNLKPRMFVRKVFTTSLIIRVIWVIFSYFLYLTMNGEPFEFGAADSHTYQAIAVDLATRGYGVMQSVFYGLQINDMGYGTYLGTLYMLTGKSILIARLLKAVWGAWTVLLIYKLASRNFGESTGRIAGIMAMLWPNLIYYCGLHLKETEMVFLTVAFLERTDYLLRSNKFTFINIIIPLLLALALFTFRTVLGAAALFGLFSALMFSSIRVSKIGNRFLIGIWVVVAVGYFVGGTIASEVEQTWENRDRNQQESMAWRASREGGNTLSKYASTTLFAPAIFVIPISTMVDVGGQENQMMIHGGNYVKNILSFFIYFVVILIIRKKKWRDFVLIETFFLGYLAVIAMSGFAQSERFHQPALPVYIILISYGIANATNKTKRYFNWYAIGVVLIVFAWNYIKLRGRGFV